MRKSLEISGIGVEEMADKMGVARSTLGAWINGRRTPRRPTLIAWAQYTEVPLGWLEKPEQWQHTHPLLPETLDAIDTASRRTARKAAGE